MALTYRLRDTDDPEERLEDAAMFKALWDASGGTLLTTAEQDADFGCIGNGLRHSATLPYWTDPVFLENCGREFYICDWEKSLDKIADLHSRGKDAFVKSGFDKYFIAKIKRGDDIRAAFGDMAYSFIDSPVPLMVQELVDFTFEHRFFVVDRKVVTFSPAAYHLTPLDFGQTDGLGWRKQSDTVPEEWNGAIPLYVMARDIAKQMRTTSAAVDIGLIDGKPAVVEFNPLRAGQIGLFACDVKALARAIYAQHLPDAPDEFITLPRMEME